IWAQPRLSIVSMMKSRRFRFEAGATQKIPRLQMSPICIGDVVIWLTAHVAPDGPFARLSDCAAYRFQGQAGGNVGGLPVASGPAQPPGSALPRGSVGRISVVLRYATSTWPGLPAAIAGKKCVPVSAGGLTRYACAALPGTSPPPPSHVEPPALDHQRCWPYSHAGTVLQNV